MPWDSGENNNWNNSSLKTYLNGDYYNSIDSVSREMISAETFHLGGPGDDNEKTLTASGYYDVERSDYVPTGNPTSTTQNIGLLYPSDYGYAAGESCLSIPLYNYDVHANDCPDNDYLYNIDNNNEDKIRYWLQNPGVYGSLTNHYNAMIIEHTGSVHGNVVEGENFILPVTYLKTTVQITGGEGTENNPYKLGTENGVSTSTLEKPTFRESETSSGKTVTITYPSGCGSSLTCSYQKDNGSVVNVTSSTVNVEFTESGSLVANVSDSVNKVSSSYTVFVPEYTPGDATSVITTLASKKADELYTDTNDNIRYYGANPNNYVTFDGELWRIIGIVDGKVKIVRNESIGSMQWNSNSSNDWNNSSLKTYLNGTYYNQIDKTYQNMIATETYYLGGPNSSNYKTLTADGYYEVERSGEVYGSNATSTSQNIGLMYPSDYGYAAGKNCSWSVLYSSSCKDKDYLNVGVAEWLQIPYISNSTYVSYIYSSGAVFVFSGANTSRAIRPTLYLKANVQITEGAGTESDPFQLSQ